MLGGLHAVVVLSVYAVAEGVAPLESAGGLEDLELYHDLHPLKLVVFLEELQICYDFLLDRVSGFVVKVQVMTDQRILQQEEVEKTVEKNFIVLLRSSLKLFVIIAEIRAKFELSFRKAVKFCLRYFRCRFGITRAKKVKIMKQSVHHTEIDHTLATGLENIEAVL